MTDLDLAWASYALTAQRTEATGYHRTRRLERILRRWYRTLAAFEGARERGAA